MTIPVQTTLIDAQYIFFMFSIIPTWNFSAWSAFCIAIFCRKYFFRVLRLILMWKHCQYSFRTDALSSMHSFKVHVLTYFATGVEFPRAIFLTFPFDLPRFRGIKFHFFLKDGIVPYSKLMYDAAKSCLRWLMVTTVPFSCSKKPKVMFLSCGILVFKVTQT